MIPDRPDAGRECAGRRAPQVQADAAVLLQHLDLEIVESLQQRGGVVQLAAAVEHRDGAGTQALAQRAVNVGQAADLVLREHGEMGHGLDPGIDALAGRR